MNERRDEDGRCISCRADIDHYHGCPDDPDPDYDDPFYATISGDYAIAPNRTGKDDGGAP